MPDKVKKTAKIIGLANLILLPFYLFSNNLGLILSIILTAFILDKLAKIGEKLNREQVGFANRAIGALSFWTSNPTTNKLTTSIDNILTGGENIYDSLLEQYKKFN